MGRDWKQWAVDKGLQKWFRRDNLVILVLSGILLVIIALPSKKERGGESEGGEAGGTPFSDYLADPPQEESPAGQSFPEDEMEAYAAHLEARLTEVLSQMADVGKVRVMITLKSSEEVVLDKEQPVSRSTTNESDSQGGSRVLSQVEFGDTTVYSTNGRVSEPYVVKTLTPRIEGVLVVAEGAGSGTTNRTISEIVQALFGVEAHKVVVVKMDSIYFSTSSYNEVVKGEEGNESEKPN